MPEPKRRLSIGFVVHLQKLRRGGRVAGILSVDMIRSSAGLSGPDGPGPTYLDMFRVNVDRWAPQCQRADLGAPPQGGEDIMQHNLESALKAKVVPAKALLVNCPIVSIEH